MNSFIAVIASILIYIAGVHAKTNSFKGIPGGMVIVPGGYYKPLFKEDDKNARQFIKSFILDSHPVTNMEYLKFVRADREWRRSNVKRIFADRNYLRKWKNDLEPGGNIKLNEPVTDISWFAAIAYCKWAGKRLPTVSEWEYFINKNNPKMNSNKILFEWTFDFNSSDFSQRDGYSQTTSICGGAGSNANDPMNYDAFLRFSFRNTLKANYSLDNLTFRCVDISGKDRK